MNIYIYRDRFLAVSLVSVSFSYRHTGMWNMTHLFVWQTKCFLYCFCIGSFHIECDGLVMNIIYRARLIICRSRLMIYTFKNFQETHWVRWLFINVMTFVGLLRRLLCVAVMWVSPPGRSCKHIIERPGPQIFPDVFYSNILRPQCRHTFAKNLNKDWTAADMSLFCRDLLQKGPKNFKEPSNCTTP